MSLKLLLHASNVTYNRKQTYSKLMHIVEMYYIHIDHICFCNYSLKKNDKNAFGVHSDVF